MYYVYVLQSLVSNYYYKGITNDIERRFTEHSNGENKFTKRYLPIRLIFVEICKNRQEARKMEVFLKSGYGREIIKELVTYL